jgi:signal transduction histidine kinase
MDGERRPSASPEPARQQEAQEPLEAPLASFGARARTGFVAVGRGAAFCGLMFAGLGLLAVLLFPLGGVVFGLGFAIAGPAWEPASMRLSLVVLMLLALFVVVPLLTTGVLAWIRSLANLTRQLSGRWCGVPIAEPYQPRPPQRGLRRRLAWQLTDRATWRDLSWVMVNASVAWVLVAAPAVLVVVALYGILQQGAGGPFAGVANDSLKRLLVGLLLLAAGLLIAPALLRGYGLLARTMLAPSGSAELARRVQHLSQTRTETLDTGAAEIRRIERDLHDGAQARLVAMGMTLDAAGQLIDEDPKAARALLIEARDNSAKALKELRALVRGIHPPVLADRGLADAIEALALDTPLRIHLASDVAGRPPAPVESAAYFAVSELLANVSKHAEAHQAWVDIRHTDEMLRIGVTDDGQGGAEPSQGTGLRGIERRLAAFDGVLAISSPPGGPTAVTMEIPCVLSSPKTSFS